MSATGRIGGRSLSAGLAGTLLLSVVVTLVIAWPVVRSPETQLFGREIAGRHHDPFTVMRQFASGGAPAPYRQPLTDEPGAWLARVVGPIPAYNLLVLLSFPLTALTTYLLGRYLLRSHPGAMVAALVFAFAPVHLAQAAYHVHIAQTQWLPLYLLALFAAVDRPTPWRGALLMAAVATLVLSNDYAGLIGAMITPVALPAYWLAQGRARTWRGLVLPAAALALAIAAAVIVASRTMPALLTQTHAFAFPVEDLARYGAQWWAYWLPPVDHPLLGGLAQRVFRDGQFAVGIVELQLSLGWSLTVLAALGVAAAGRHRGPFGAGNRAMLAVAAVGLWSFIASLAPASPGCAPASLTPACLVYQIAPVFRGYARLGIMTSLCVALLAGYAVAYLGSRPNPARPRPATRRWLIGAALAVAAIEYWPFPGRARDILPTAGHRWLAERPEAVHILDCTARRPAEATLPWLMGKNIELIGTAFEGCDEPEFVPKLAALGVTHVITRGSRPEPWTLDLVPGVLGVAAAFPDARVYTVSAVPSPLVVLDTSGFFSWERKDEDRWRWMGQEGSWTLLNTTASDVSMTLHFELQAFAEPRHLTITLDTQPLPGVEVAVSRREYVVGPMTVTPGQHVLRFHTLEPAARPFDLFGSSDRRPLTIAIGPWRWSSAR